MTIITPVILCGGSGTRLWPLSRKSYPKQFSPLLDETSLFQASALRLAGDDFAMPMVMTGSDFRFVVTDKLEEIGLSSDLIIIEPEGRNTAPAILTAALVAHRADPEAVLLVAPSDHVIPDASGFCDAVRAGLPAVAEGRIVTFGIRPDRPETGYGYLRLAAQPGEDGAATPLEAFVEKPNRSEAEQLIASGTHLWNAGVFLFAAKDMLAAFEAHAPGLIGPVTRAVEAASTDLGFLRLDAAAWAEAEDISIDYAVMEKIDNISVVPFDGAWSDLGSWEAVLRESASDAKGVATRGQARAIDCTNSLLRSESPNLELVGLGLDNIVAVATPDAVLVADVSRAQDVKTVVDVLKSTGAKQAIEFPMDHRPWGHFETLALSDRFQVKRIVVKPGAALSLQSHFHRSEHWIVVAGTAKVTIDDEVKLLTENQSVYIPLGAVHRMENPGKVAMVLIEVQTGAYLGEDDIVRYEDIYARGEGAKG